VPVKGDIDQYFKFDRALSDSLKEKVDRLLAEGEIPQCLQLALLYHR